MADTAELMQEDKQKLLQGSSNIKSGVASLVKGDTSLENIDHIVLGMDFISIAVHKLELLEKLPQVALTTTVAKLRMIDAFANFAEATQKMRDGDITSAAKVQFVSASSQAMGATGMWLEGFAASGATSALTSALIAEVGAGLNWDGAALGAGVLLGYKNTSDNFAIDEAEIWNRLTDGTPQKITRNMHNELMDGSVNFTEKAIHGATSKLWYENQPKDLVNTHKVTTHNETEAKATYIKQGKVPDEHEAKEVNGSTLISIHNGKLEKKSLESSQAAPNNGVSQPHAESTHGNNYQQLARSFELAIKNLGPQDPHLTMLAQKHIELIGSIGFYNATSKQLPESVVNQIGSNLVNEIKEGRPLQIAVNVRVQVASNEMVRA